MMRRSTFDDNGSLSIHGVGLGLRTPHIENILQHKPQVPWFELLTDNWLGASGIDGVLLDEILKHYPVSLHGVAMNIGGVMPLNTSYLTRVKELAQRCDTTWVSDHLAFTAVDGRQFHDLAPLPYTEEALLHVCERIDAIQNHLGFALTVENISAYVAFKHETLDEADFLNALADRTGCHILLDVNNLYVNQVNLNKDAKQFLQSLKAKHVKEIHLGGFTHKGDYLLDAHDHPVAEPVWELYELAMGKFINTPTLIEWDNALPDFDTLMAEKIKADMYWPNTMKSCDAKASLNVKSPLNSKVERV